MEIDEFSLLHNSIYENSMTAINIIREVMTEQPFNEIIDLE